MGASAAAWVSKILQEKSPEVAAARDIAPNLVEIDRTEKQNFLLGVSSVKLVTYDVIAPFISNNFLISFVVNIPKEAVWTGEAIKALDARPIGFGGMGDLNRALREDDPRHYVFREYAYAERRLRQHRNVIDTDRLYDRVWQVNRKSGNSINVAISNEYDLTADEVRTVHDRYAPVSVIFHTNGMGRITKEAHEAADELDIEIIDSDGLPELLRR